MTIKTIKLLGKKILLIIFKFGLRFKLIILPDHYYVPVSNILELNKDRSWQKKSVLVNLINNIH